MSGWAGGWVIIGRGGGVTEGEGFVIRVVLGLGEGAGDGEERGIIYIYM